MTETEQQEENLLVDTNEYLKAGVHIGTKFKTKYMKDFIYKTRPDGLSVLNLKKIDERMRVACKFLSNYKPEEILIVSRRENGWKGLRILKKLTGINIIIGRYPPGILTNTNLETFFEPKVMVVCDPWPDKNAVVDASKAGIPVVSFCDTNNEPNNSDLIIPANNKGKKSIGLLLYIITREYLRSNGLLRGDQELEGYEIADFVEE
jgi:small subunit ribosomal protein S2